MDQIQAKRLMAAGEKLTHRYFSPEEWVTMIGNQYQFEDGVRCSYEEFWSHRSGPAWFSDWEIYTDSEITK